MRRMVLTTTASALVLAVAPASALAQRHHHKRHHGRTHHARTHHVRVRHLRFGDVTTPPSSTTTTPTPTTPPTTPRTPPASAIGTVASFDGTTLMITLTDGSTVSGVVTNDTEIECEAPSMSTTMHSDDGGGDHGGNGSGDNQSSGSGNQSGGDDNGQGDDQNENENNQACATANLRPGASVGGAELRISSDGSVWEKIDLIS